MKDAVVIYPYNPGRAVELLAEAGWRRGADGRIMKAAGEHIALPFQSGSGGGQNKDVPIIADNWKAVGLGVNQVVLSPGDSRDTRRVAEFQAVMWSSIPLAFEWNLARVHGPRCPSEANQYTGANAGCYQNPAHDRIIDSLYTAIDPGEQRRLWRELVRHQTEDLPLLPLYFNVTVGTKPRSAMTWNVAEWDVK